MSAKPERSQDSFRAIFLAESKSNQPSPWPKAARDDLDEVFASSTLSYREMVALVIFARLIDPSYDPTVDLYACNPRTLYEKHMRGVLKDEGVPCGQSPALNIAKAGEGLTQEWAARRRPKEHAQALLRLLELIRKMSVADLRVAALDVGKRLKHEALQSALTFNDLEAVDSAVLLSQVSRGLIERFTLKGQVPQWITGAALEAIFLGIPGVVVSGAADSSSATNKTSGKPGDLSVTVNGKLTRIYEVTVKAFGEQRIGECVSTLRQLFPGDLSLDMVVLVLCRPQDVPNGATRAGIRDSLHLGEFIEDGIVFEFLDIFAWITATLAELPLANRRFFFHEVQKYLNEPRMPAEVREYWATAFT